MVVINTNKKQNYIKFNEYIKASDSHKRERAEAWRVAIGLQAVDGLQVSEYLIELAKKNIEGELTIDEVRELIKKHYEEKRKIKRMDYETYTRINVHPDPEGAKMGRLI